MQNMVNLNVKVDDYTNRVLGVIKEKYGLKDKGMALNRFVEEYGEEYVDKEVKDEVIKEVIESCNNHIKKYGFRAMSTKELEKLCRGK